MIKTNFNKIQKNIIVSILYMVISTIFGLILPRMIILNFDSTFNGFVTSVSQIFGYLILFEAGIGLASVNLLFKPIFEKNYAVIRNVIFTSSIFFSKALKLFLIFIIFIFLIFLFSNNYYDFNSFITIFLVNSLLSVFNLLFVNKFKILFDADGKTYVLTFLNLVNLIIVNLFRILSIVYFNNFVFFILANLLSLPTSYIFIRIYLFKNYSWFFTLKSPELIDIPQRNSVLFHQFSSLIFNNTDVFLLTFFSSFSLVSVYSIYSFIFLFFRNFSSSFSNSFNYLIGRWLHNEKQYLTKHFVGYFDFNLFIVFTINSLLFLLVGPFIDIYTLGFDNRNFFNNTLPYFFIVINLLLGIRAPFRQLIEISGSFSSTNIKVLIEVIINLSISIILVGKFNIIGILIGTICALLYRTIDMIIYSKKNIISFSLTNIIFKILILLFIFLLINLSFANMFTHLLISYFNLFFYGFLSLVLLVFVWFIIFVALFHNFYRQSLQFIKALIFNKNI